jgi:hypothetical protein
MRRFMCASVLLAIIVAGHLFSSLAGAATSEDLYRDVRDAAIAKIKGAIQAEKRGPTDSYGANIQTMDEQARASLERQMRVIVGPVAIKGLQERGTLNLDTLIEGDESFGVLDGLIYASADDKTHVIVTTDNLFQRWLIQHKDWWGKDRSDMPQEPGAAVKESAFYSQAVVTDAAIIRFAELPVRRPAGAAFAFAMLAARTQSEAPAKADEIFIAVAHGGRVYIGQTKRLDPVGPIASCDAIRAELVKKADAAAQQQDLDDTKRQEKSDSLRGKSETDFLRCFAEQASRQNSFAGAVSAAQDLIDRVLPR